MFSRPMFRRLLLAGGALAVLHPTAVRAQAVNYGALEELFGQPVTTSVTGKPQLASAVPGDLVIITQDDIRRSGADNIPDILQFVTGIDVQKNTFGDTQIGIRGYNSAVSPRLLVMVDGRQVYLDDYGYVAWNMIPVQLDEIRQIEVVKGPASALFGFNAASGVINIITYDPLLDNVNTATVRGGTQGYGGGDGVATVHFGKTVGVRVSLGGWTSTGFPTQTGGLDPVRPRYDSFNISGRWQVASDILLRAEAGTTDGQTERYLSVAEEGDVQNHVNFWRFGGAANTRIGSIDFDIYRNHAVNGFSGAFSTINNTNDVLVAKLTDILKLNPNNTIRLGLEFRHNALAFESASRGALSYNVFAVNGMWDWQISPSVNLNNAVRLDNLELSDTGVFFPSPGRTRALYDATTITTPSFNSGLVIKASDKDTIRLTAARGLQLPSLIDFGLQIVLPGFAYVGSPSVAPVAVWNAELAYDRKLDWLGATLTSAVFFQRNTDLIAPAGSGAATVIDRTVVLTSQNVGSSNEIGLEVGLRGTTDSGFRWNASYRYASITDDIDSADRAIQNQLTHFDSGTPVQTVILGAGYSRQQWEFDVQGRWQSSYTDFQGSSHGDEPVIIGNYVSMNARIGYRVTNYLTLSGTAEQFNVSRLLETTGDYVDRRFIASANVHF